MAKELTTDHLASIINKAKSVAESKISENEDSKIINNEDVLNNITKPGTYILSPELSAKICNGLHANIEYYHNQYPSGLTLVIYDNNGVVVQSIHAHYGVYIIRLKVPNQSYMNWIVVRPKYYENGSVDSGAIKSRAIQHKHIDINAISKEHLNTLLYNELSNESKVFTISTDNKETTELFTYLENGGIKDKVIIKLVDEFGSVLAIAGIYSYDNDTVTTNPVITENRIVMIEFYKTNDYNYVPYDISGISIKDNTISQTKLSFNLFERSNNAITKLTNLEIIPNKYGTYLYDLKDNLIVTFNESDFNEVHIIIHNTTASAKEIVFPGTDNYILFSGDLLQVPAGAYVELNVIKDPVTEFYYVRFA